MAAFLDNVRFTASAGGTTDWTFSAAVAGSQTPALGGAVNGRVYKFLAISGDKSQWEIAEGAYNSTGAGSFARTTVLYNSSGSGAATGQSGAGTKINFSAAPDVAIIGAKEDLISIEEANAFTSTQKDQARKNVGAIGKVTKQIFTASGTYTPSANMLFCIIEAVGAGGGGGSVLGSSTSTSGGGNGGGAGSRSIKWATAADIGASQTVTIGPKGTGGASGAANSGTAGGDTSVGTLCIGKGASGGGPSSGAVSPVAGAGGVAGTGDLAIPGMSGDVGGWSQVNSAMWGRSGSGGSTIYGAGGKAVSAGNGSSAAGNAGQGFGSGGSGGAITNANASAAGADGAGGIVVITEFCAA